MESECTAFCTTDYRLTYLYFDGLTKGSLKILFVELSRTIAVSRILERFFCLCYLFAKSSVKGSNDRFAIL